MHKKHKAKSESSQIKFSLQNVTNSFDLSLLKLCKSAMKRLVVVLFSADPCVEDAMASVQQSRSISVEEAVLHQLTSANGAPFLSTKSCKKQESIRKVNKVRTVNPTKHKTRH